MELERNPGAGLIKIQVNDSDPAKTIAKFINTTVRVSISGFKGI
jgi:hypothetical protein